MFNLVRAHRRQLGPLVNLLKILYTFKFYLKNRVFFFILKNLDFILIFKFRIFQNSDQILTKIGGLFKAGAGSKETGLFFDWAFRIFPDNLTLISTIIIEEIMKLSQFTVLNCSKNQAFGLFQQREVETICEQLHLANVCNSCVWET